MLWQLRPPTEADVSFIFSSWLKSHRQSPINADMGNNVYFAHMHKAIEETIRGPSTAIIVACAPTEPDVIFGYGVAETIGDELVLHLVYVKHSFRGFGLGKALEAEILKLPHTKISYSCQTKLAKTLNRKRQFEYNPFHLLKRG